MYLTVKDYQVLSKHWLYRTHDIQVSLLQHTKSCISDCGR